MKKNNYQTIRKKVLKTELGKKVYRRLTISTIILILSLLGQAIIMSIFCHYCLNGGNFETFKFAFTTAPFIFTISLVTGILTCFFAGEYCILIKTYNKNK